MISLLLYIAMIGLICWALVRFVPLPAPFQQIIVGVGAVLAILIVLQAFGVHTGVTIPGLRS